MKTRYDFESEIDELLDEALNELSPKEYDRFLDSVSMSMMDHGYEGSNSAFIGGKNAKS